MKKKIASLVAGICIVCAINVNALTTVERIGEATGEYYFAVLIVKLLSESRCSSSLKIGRNEYDLNRVKAGMNATLARFATKDELRQMSQFFLEQELETKKKFVPAFRNATSDQCRQFVSEFSEMFYKHKSKWQSLTR